MEVDRKILRLAAAIVIGVALLHMAADLLPEKPFLGITQEDVIRTIFFLQTGRMIQFSEETIELPAETEPGPTEEILRKEQQPEQVIFTQKDVERVQVSNLAGYTVDVEQMLQQPLEWMLRAEKPTVLVLHTHGTESYENTEGYVEDSDYRTLDETYNMVSVGERLVQCLEAGGVQVIHDRTPYDQPSYSGSYSQARSAIQTILEENPSICLILDLHRDAMTNEQGEQIGYTQQTLEGTAAKLMLVSGSDAGGLEYPDWQENLSLAVKLQAILERRIPGICRPVSFRTGRYNQDLFPNMLLVEVGAAGNTRQDALLAAEHLASAILEMAAGTQYQ